MIENIRQKLKQLSDIHLDEFRSRINREIRHRMGLWLGTSTSLFDETTTCPHSDYDLRWMREAQHFEYMSRTIPAYYDLVIPDEEITRRVDEIMKEIEKNQNWNSPEG